MIAGCIVTALGRILYARSFIKGRKSLTSPFCLSRLPFIVNHFLRKTASGTIHFTPDSRHNGVGSVSSREPGRGVEVERSGGRLVRITIRLPKPCVPCAESAPVEEFILEGNEWLIQRPAGWKVSSLGDSEARVENGSQRVAQFCHM